MESRLLLLFLTLTVVVGGLTGCGRDRLVRTDDGGQPPVIEPDVARRDVEPPRIDTEDFEVGVLLGQISVEDFGVNTVAGARFAYHVTEGFFVELAAGQADTELTSFERLSGAAQLLTDEQREYGYYNVSLGYNIFPGEGFVGRRRAFNMATYVIGGVGRTKFAGDDRFTVNLGVGMRLMPLDWLAIHGDIRDHVFDIDLLGQEKTAHNIETTVGVTFFF
jgi:outer membrane beta-barrel protein